MIQTTRALYQDVEAFWAQQIVALGGQYRPAALSFFSTPLLQTCGVATPLVGSFYCPPTETVYLDQPFLQRIAQRAPGASSLALGYVVAHELAHHVQNTVGTTALVDEARARSAPQLAARTLVAFELQADCYAGLWLRWAQQRGSIAAPVDLAAVLDDVAAIARRQQSRLRAGEQMLDPLTHGTAAQRLKWLHQGMDLGNFSACDTFGAEAAGTP
jgi:hypothetical protein